MQGIDMERLKFVKEIIKSEQEKGTIPGATLLIGYEGQRIRFTSGYAVHTADLQLDVTPHTIYDCASLTKVIVTLPLILLLIEQGKITLADPVSRYFPKFIGKHKENVTIKQLLNHTSGLPSYINLRNMNRTRKESIDYITQLELQYIPGEQYVYSDLGYILLGEIIAQLFGQTLDVVAKQYLFEPLHMHHSCYNPSLSLRDQIAATEYVVSEQTLCWGQVHDENARSLDGISGHAGLFATANDIGNYAQMWLEQRTNLLSLRAKIAATANQTNQLAAVYRGLGWVLRGDKWDVSGDWMSPSVYSHTGFTGTSLCIDPELSLYIVLLSNHVHYNRNNSVARLRRVIHNIVSSSIIN